MFYPRIVEVLNSGTAWAFVGSGVSVDAGLPTWGGLVDAVLHLLPQPDRGNIECDPLYVRALREGHHDKRLAQIQKQVGRPALEVAVASVLAKIQTPGSLHPVLADLPFHGYITTNYDLLLEGALREQGLRGWSPVGNTRAEIRKLAGNPDRVVWHPHGYVTAAPGLSNLVLTDTDYDDLYLEDSAANVALRALFLMAPVVFIGFSFADAEVSRVLKRVGRLASPERPLIALIAGLSGPDHEAEREEFLLKYNIDVIPYETANGSHAALRSTLDLHASFVLARSLRFGQPQRNVPSFDPEATSLMIYNELVIGPNSTHASSVLEGLLRARVIALLTDESPRLLKDLEGDLRSRAALLADPTNTRNGTPAIPLQETVAKLVSEGVVSAVTTAPEPSYALTAEWKAEAEERRARIGLLSAQFLESLRGRTLAMGCKPPESAARIARVAAAFLEDSVRRRALGTAMTLAARETTQQRFHVVALLQALPAAMAQLPSPEEAGLLSRLVRDVLTTPDDAERSYLGFALQAAFGAHLLGCSPDAIEARVGELAGTLFLIDSTTLIPYLARDCTAHETARFLLRRLTALGCGVATLPSLAEEVAEHARYAMHKVSALTGGPDLETLKAVTGRAGGRSNEFLNGFLVEISKGSVQPDLSVYLSASCGVPVSRTNCSARHVQAALGSAGVTCVPFQDWPGFRREFWADREAIAEDIAARRKQQGNFKHDRQTRAEAESLIIVRELRNKQLSAPTTAKPRVVRNAFFVSNSRVIDDVAKPTLPVTMRLDAIAQWVATMAPCDMKELASTFDLLLLELAEQGFRVIEDRALLTVFGPLVDASRERLPEIRIRHSTLLANRLGEDPAKAFTDVPDLELPVATESFYAQLAEALERRALKSEAAAPLNRTERGRLEKLESDDRARSDRARRKQRALAGCRKPKRKTSKAKLKRRNRKRK